MSADTVTASEYAENVCQSLNLPIRGVAFIYIENAIQAAVDENTAQLKARLALLEQLNRDLTTALVNTEPSPLELAQQQAIREAETLLTNYLVDGKFPIRSDCEAVRDVLRKVIE